MNGKERGTERMWKRFLTFFLAILTAVTCMAGPCVSAIDKIYYDGAWHTYKGNTFRLKVDGKELSCSVPPIVFSDYSVVPARDVFEHVGATVTWFAGEQKVLVKTSKHEIILYINKTVAYKNGKAEPMPIAPKIINEKTMIPVRYVAESLGYDVQFDSKTDTILIDTGAATLEPSTPVTPEKPATPQASVTLNSYKGTVTEEGFSIKFTLSKAITDYSDFALKEPTRVVLDLGDVKLGTGVGNSTYTSKFVTAVRFGQHDGVLRVVLDTVGEQPYRVSASGKTVTVTMGKVTNASDKPATVPDDKEDTETPEEEEDVDKHIVIPEIESIVIPPSRSITIDAGHGGSDPGAIYTDEDGKIWKESDINLGVALKLRDILAKKGVRVVMTRTKDVTVERRSRPLLANKEETALFISIHTNSVAASDKANGIETWGNLVTSKPLADVTDKSFAENVQKAVIKKTSATDRGIKDSLDLTVIVYSAMPAVLVEVGFITNEAERELLFSDAYRTKLAEGLAEGILATFTDMGV